MFSILNNGGPFMYVILGVSVISMAIFVERATFLYYRMRMNMDNAFNDIVAPLEKKDFNAALEECSKIKKHPLGSILKAGLLKADRRSGD